MDGKARRIARARTQRRATRRLRRRRSIRRGSASRSRTASRSRSSGPEDPEKILLELRMEIAMLEEEIKTAPTHGAVFALLLRIRELTEQADALEAVLR